LNGRTLTFQRARSAARIRAAQTKDTYNAHNGIATFEGKLTGSGNLTLNPHSVGYIDVNGNTEVIVNTTNTAETVTNANVSAANMEVVLVGIHLGLKSADFHHF
jgi:hypothetical protein